MKNVIRPSYDLYINGRWVPSSDGSTFKAINLPTVKSCRFVPKRRRTTSMPPSAPPKLPSRPGKTYRPENDRPSS